MAKVGKLNYLRHTHQNSAARSVEELQDPPKSVKNFKSVFITARNLFAVVKGWVVFEEAYGVISLFEVLHLIPLILRRLAKFHST